MLIGAGQDCRVEHVLGKKVVGIARSAGDFLARFQAGNTRADGVDLIVHDAILSLAVLTATITLA